jgi:hypothetical protein
MSLTSDERQVRRRARQVGLRVEKSPARTPADPTHGLYRLVEDAPHGRVVVGAEFGQGFTLDLADLAAYLDSHPAV